MINHIALLVDISGSMLPYRKELSEIVKKQIKTFRGDFAENRISIYTFGDHVQSLTFERDALRFSDGDPLASVRPYGMTAMRDAIARAIDDFSSLRTTEGDHSFLIMSITDGVDNCSRTRPRHLSAWISTSGDNWTFGAMVNHAGAVSVMKGMGLSEGNISVWDSTSKLGFEKAGETMASASKTFSVERSSGKRSTKKLFSTGTDNVNEKTVIRDLTPLGNFDYLSSIVTDQFDRTEIRRYVQGVLGLPFVLGNSYYELKKRETIQPQKKLLVMNRRTKQFFTGDVRGLLGLPSDVEVRVTPNLNQDYTVFVQSTSTNRKVDKWTTLVVLTP